MLRSLAERDLQPEVMDRPDLAVDRHRHALAGLARVNVLSRSSALVWRPIRALARREGLCELTVLDVASGGGDVAVGLCRRAASAGVRLRVVGYDVSPVAVETASRRAERAGVDARFEVADVFASAPERRFDVVMTSLFLHHLTEAQGIELLRRMNAAARRLTIVNDLRRSRLGYALAQIVVRVVTRSDVVRYDGPQSVAGAFRTDEVARLCAAAGWSRFELRRVWPFRFLLTGMPSS